MTAAATAISFVEAAYRLDGDEAAWLERVLRATRKMTHAVVGRVVDGRYAVSCYAGRSAAASQWLERWAHVVASGQAELPIDWWTTAGNVCESMVQRLSRLYGQQRALRMASRLPLPPGARDMFGVGIVAASGRRSVILAAPLAEVATSPVSRPRRERWARLGAHILAGLRMRDHLAGPGLGALQSDAGQSDARVEAVLELDGRCVHAEGAAKASSARRALRVAATAIDRARGPLRRRDADEALEIWRGLVGGRWSIVDRFDSDGRRYLVARRNELDVEDPRLLTRREREVVALARQGHSNKLVAYMLGLATSTVATHLASAMRKLGVSSRVELVRLSELADER